MNLLSDPAICAEISRAWRESPPDDPTGRHEEGGFIVRNPDRSHGVERWPRGGQSRIMPPSLDVNNCYNAKMVIATFHTHPNPPVDESGREWEQDTSTSDRRWHRRRNLRGFVVSRMFVYEIDVAGRVSLAGNRDEVLSA